MTLEDKIIQLHDIRQDVSALKKTTNVLNDMILEEMLDNNLVVVKAGHLIASVVQFSSRRVDSALLRLEYPAIYDNVLKTIYSQRLLIK